MTQRKIILSAFGAALIGATALYAQRDVGSSVAYPAGFRKWVHVKTVLVGPQSPGFSDSGGIHHVYANAKAMEGYEAGKFPNGAIFVFDLLEAKETNGVTVEGARRRVDVMVKDAQRFSSSGGWGFERFLGDGETDRPLTEESRAQCFSCHEQVKARDFVFSQYRK